MYEVARTIPAGETWTYGVLAARAGSPGAARAVGQAMARNPFPLIVPCHRVTGAQGWAGGFSAHGGVDTKFRLLRIEGARAGSVRYAERPGLGTQLAHRRTETHADRTFHVYGVDSRP